MWYAYVASRFGKCFLTTCSLLLVLPHSRQLCQHLNIACLYLETEILVRRNFYTGWARGGRALDVANARSDSSTCSLSFCFCGGGRACPYSNPAVMNRDAALTLDETPLALSRALSGQGRMEGEVKVRGCERSNKGTREGDIARSSTHN